MSLLKLGKTFLGTKSDGAFPTAARFDTDPRINREWPIRRNRFENVGGEVTHQDFGRWAVDLVLQLDSQSNYIGREFKAYLDTKAGIRGASYDYKDYQGLEAEVVILDWKPKPTFIADGIGVLWEYQLTLQVIEMSVLDFAAYTEE